MYVCWRIVCTHGKWLMSTSLCPNGNAGRPVWVLTNILRMRRKLGSLVELSSLSGWNFQRRCFFSEKWISNSFNLIKSSLFKRFHCLLFVYNVLVVNILWYYWIICYSSNLEKFFDDDASHRGCGMECHICRNGDLASIASEENCATDTQFYELASNKFNELDKVSDKSQELNTSSAANIPMNAVQDCLTNDECMYDSTNEYADECIDDIENPTVDYDDFTYHVTVSDSDSKTYNLWWVPTKCGAVRICGADLTKVTKCGAGLMQRYWILGVHYLWPNILYNARKKLRIYCGATAGP